MKICEKCGAHNSDERQFCVDCSARLSNPISKNEEEKQRAKLDKKINGLDNEADGFKVRTYDIVVGGASLVCIVAMIVALLCGAYGVKEELPIEHIMCTGIIFIISAVFSFFPKLYWFIYKLRYIFYVKDWETLRPSEFFIVLRKACPTVLVIIGILVNYTLLF